MATKKPLNNPVLLPMFLTGAALLLLGLLVWVGNSDFDYDPSAYSPGTDESDPAAQTLGIAIVMLGGILVVLGWTAAAICRQIADQ